MERRSFLVFTDYAIKHVRTKQLKSTQAPLTFIFYELVVWHEVCTTAPSNRVVSVAQSFVNSVAINCWRSRWVRRKTWH